MEKGPGAVGGVLRFLRTPFGSGYRFISYAYKNRTHELLAADLLGIAGLTADKYSAGSVRISAELRAAYQQASASQGRHGGRKILGILDKVWRQKLLQVAALEVVAAVLKVFAVFWLGFVLREIELGMAVPPSWVMSTLGVEAAEHAALRSVPFAVIVLVGRLAQQAARHRRAQTAAEVGAVLQSWLFRAASASSADLTAQSWRGLPALLESLPSLADAWAKGSRSRLWAPALGSSLAALALLHALGALGVVVGCGVTAVLLASEATLRRRWAPIWRAKANEIRQRREAVAAAFLSEDGNSAVAVVKVHAWERSVFRRLGLLRAEEREALRRQGRCLALAWALRSELMLLLPTGAALTTCAALPGMQGAGALSVWNVFQALAASQVLAEQLRQLSGLLLVRRPTEQAAKVEAAVQSFVPASAPPLQGDRATYRAAKYAIAIEGMRFFWQSDETGTAQPDPPAAAPAGFAKKLSQKKASSGLDMVDSVTDDASVAERARRATHGVYKFDLKVLSFQVKRGSSVALVGATGCGKSTLLLALLGGCKRELWGDDAEGNGVFLSGRLAYAPQKPKLLHGCSIRENVLAGLPMDSSRYEQALVASTLAEDLASLPLGDRHAVHELPGEAALACLQLARALYCEAQILLLDDPLVALETARAKKVLANLVKKTKDRTVLLVTQNLSLLSQLDSIVVIRNGTIFEQGDFKTLSSMPTEFSRMLLISDQKEKFRSAVRRLQGAEGLPCPFLCYEVGPDPMKDIFPQDHAFEEGEEVISPTFDTVDSLKPDKWGSQRIGLATNPAGETSSAPWETQWSSMSRGTAGVKIRDGQWTTQGSRQSGNVVEGSKTGVKSHRHQLGGGNDRRRGFVFDAPAAQQIQDFFDTHPTGDVEGGFPPAFLGLSQQFQDQRPGRIRVDDLFTAKGRGSNSGDGAQGQGQGSARRSRRESRGKSSKGLGASVGARLFAGDDGPPDGTEAQQLPLLEQLYLEEGEVRDEASHATPARGLGKPGMRMADGREVDAGPEYCNRRRGPEDENEESGAVGSRGLPLLGVSQSQSASGDPSFVTSMRAPQQSSIPEGGELEMQMHQRALPSASAVPLVGASLWGGGYHAAAPQSSVPPPPPPQGFLPPAPDTAPGSCPEDQGIPHVSSSAAGARAVAASVDQWAYEEDQMLLPPFPAQWPVEGNVFDTKQSQVDASRNNFPTIATAEEGSEELPPLLGPVPSSPHSTDGLRRRFMPPSGFASDDGIAQGMDVEAANAPKPGLRADGAHTAAPPAQIRGRSSEDSQQDDRRSKKEDRRPKKEDPKAKKEDPRVHRLDVLERALKEKNDKIAELERQMDRGHDVKDPSLRLPSARDLGAVSSPAPERAVTSPVHGVAPRGRKGAGVALLLGYGGLSALLLVVVVLLTTLSHIGVPVMLGRLVVLAAPKSSDAAENGSAPSPDGGSGSGDVASVSGPPQSPQAADQSSSTVDTIVLYRGFATTSAAPTTATAPLQAVQAWQAISSTAPPPLTPVETPIPSSFVWASNRTGRFCSEPSLHEDTQPQASYDLDPSIGWHLNLRLYLARCKKACEDLADSWGCRFISWGGPVSTQRWCYVHRDCSSSPKIAGYQVFVLNFTAAVGGRLRRRLPSIPALSTASPVHNAAGILRVIATLRAPSAEETPGPPQRRDRPRPKRKQRRLQNAQQLPSGSQDASLLLASYSIQALLAALCLLLAVLGLTQARLAARVSLQACQETSLRQLRAVLAAPAALGERGAAMAVELAPAQQAGLTIPGLTATPGFLRDTADADMLLPLSLVCFLASSAQTTAAISTAAIAGGRQAIPAVVLTFSLAVSVYLHRLRMPLKQQLWRFRSVSEASAALRVHQLAECHDVMQAHGLLTWLCDDYEALCQVLALADTVGDVAERWLFSRLHCLIAMMLGLLVFTALAEAQSSSSESGPVMVSVALLQMTLLPEVAVSTVRHGAQLQLGLSALQRIRRLCQVLPTEELESPALHMRLPSEREQKDIVKGRAKLKARHARVVFGDSVIERGTPEEQKAALYDLARLELVQTVSVEGFALESVADDWPYFGAVEIEDLTVRYSLGLTPALQEVSLRLPACQALLLAGAEGCGKSSLIKALLRLNPAEAGRIVVDSVDVRSVGLTTLRGRIALVPQETLLFRGTWRDNLDPMGEFEEDHLRQALRLTRLENWLLRNAPKGLDEPVAENKATLGPALVLLSLCRAVLRLLQGRSKLLVMDRSTCRLSITSDADLTALILRYCRRRGVAVLQASRRLQQAALYDEVAAMRGGRVLEQGPPRQLWAQDGPFRRMAREQGLDSSKLSKVDSVAARLTSVWGWEVSPQEDPEWFDEFAVSMKKVKKN